MYSVKLTTVGNSTGAVFPKEVLDRLHVKKGDQLYLIEDDEGFRLTPYNQAFIDQMKLAESIMHKDKDVLKVLAE